jgi:hypothetical protein
MPENAVLVHRLGLVPSQGGKDSTSSSVREPQACNDLPAALAIDPIAL